MAEGALADNSGMHDGCGPEAGHCGGHAHGCCGGSGGAGGCAAGGEGCERALTAMRPGEMGVICGSRLSADDAALLRAMGLCDRATVRVCRLGEPCVVAVGGVQGVGTGGGGEGCTCGGSCRIGLARPLAERIFVTALA